MASEVTSLGQKEWEARKGRIGEKMGEFAHFQRKTIRDILPDLKAIKEKELWRHGGYDSFKAFVLQCVGVTTQHVYKLLAEDEAIVKVLEIKGGESSYLTPKPALPEFKEQPSETKYEPPTKKKTRKEKPRPEPVDVDEIASAVKLGETQESRAKFISETVGTLATPTPQPEPIGESQPDAFKTEMKMWDGVMTERMAQDKRDAATMAKCCPHCGKEIE